MEKKKYSVPSNIFYALKNIWRWDKGFYGFFFCLLAASISVSVAEIYFPKVLINSLDQGVDLCSATQKICGYLGALLALNLIRLICNAKLSARKYSISQRYQNAIWEKYMRTDYANTNSPEENIKFQNAINDANSNCAAEFIWQPLFDLAKCVIGIITYGLIIATVSPWIVLLLFFSASLTYLLGRWVTNYSEKNKDKIAALDRKIGYLTTLSSNFEHAKDIRLFSLSSWINTLLYGFQSEKLMWTKKVNLRTFFVDCATALLSLIRDCAAYVVLLMLLLRDRIDVGTFVFLFGAIVGFSVWINGISTKINEVVAKGIKVGYYREYFNIQDKFNHGEGCALPKTADYPLAIRFENVSYRYPGEDSGIDTLKNINFRINPGEKIAIVGPNGAGKTTLVKLLCGLYMPTAGTIFVNGMDIKQYNIEEYYSIISAVFQDTYLLPVTVEEFVTSSLPEKNRDKLKSVLRSVGIDKKINTLSNGVETHLMKGVFNDSIDFSGGERQKLMLARAIYKDAPILILDEPTAALDPLAENEIYLQYNSLAKNRTSIYISHRLAATRFCDRIFYLENGEIVEEGSHEDLMKLRGKYSAMFEMQSQQYKELA